MRKKKAKRNLKLLSIVVLVVLLIGVGFYYTHHTNKTRNSYKVNETATLTNTAKVYSSLSLLRAEKFNANSSVTVTRYYLPIKNDRQIYAQIQLNNNTYYVKAADLKLTMTNTINKYVAQLGYPHTNISKQLSSSFYQQAYSTSSGNPRGVVIHDTGNENSTLTSEIAYMKQNYRSTRVFVHTFIDADQIVNIANTKYMAEGAGPKANPYFVQFEMPHEYTANSFAKQLANAAYYTAYNLKQNNLPVIKGTSDGSGTVWTHSMISKYLGGTDHQDPDKYWSSSAKSLFNSSYNIDDFIELVQAYYNRI